MTTKNYFVGIGAAKSGTSWLADYLGKHREVAMSPIKELHYFDARFCKDLCGHWDKDWHDIKLELEAKYAAQPCPEVREKLQCVTLRLEMIGDHRKYLQYFEAIVQFQHRAFGEITPAYSMLPAEGFLAIKELYPKAKFVYLMRDPVERYFSQLQFSQKIRHLRGRTPQENFDADLQALQKLSNPQYMNRSDYRGTIETLLSTTGEDSLCILFYEHLFDVRHSQNELRRLCDFLGIKFMPAEMGARINASDQSSFTDEVRRTVREHFSPVYDFVYQKYGSRVPASWK